MTNHETEIEILRKTADQIDGMIADLQNKKSEIDALIGELSVLPEERTEEKREEVEPPKFRPLAKDDFLDWKYYRVKEAESESANGRDDLPDWKYYPDDKRYRRGRDVAESFEYNDFLFHALKRFWDEQKEPYPFALSVSETNYENCLLWAFEREGCPLGYKDAIALRYYRDVYLEDFFEMHDDAEELLADDKLFQRGRKVAEENDDYVDYMGHFAWAAIEYYRSRPDKIDEEFERDGSPVSYRDLLCWEVYDSCATHRCFDEPKRKEDVDADTYARGQELDGEYHLNSAFFHGARRYYDRNPKLIDEEFERLGSPISYQEFLDWELYRSYVELGDIGSDEYMSGLKVANKFNNDDAFSNAMVEYFNRHPELTDEDD